MINCKTNFPHRQTPNVPPRDQQNTLTSKMVDTVKDSFAFLRRLENRLLEQVAPGMCLLAREKEAWIKDNPQMSSEEIEKIRERFPLFGSRCLVLNLWNFSLTKAPPPALFNLLKNTTWLEIGGNQLTSLDVSCLTKLVQLDVNRNKLSSLEVRGLTDLKRLDASCNELPSLDVNGLENLEDLNLDGNKLSSFAAVGLPNFCKLHLNQNKLTSIRLINACPRSLEVTKNKDLEELPLTLSNGSISKIETSGTRIPLRIVEMIKASARAYSISSKLNLNIELLKLYAKYNGDLDFIDQLPPKSKKALYETLSVLEEKEAFQKDQRRLAGGICEILGDPKNRSFEAISNKLGEFNLEKIEKRKRARED